MRWLKRGKPPARPLVDAGYLDRLGEALGQPVLSELLSDGMIELADRLSRLDALARAGERDEAAALCHDIVSVAGHMGLGALSAAAADLNRTLRSAEGTAPADIASLPALVAPVTALGQPSIRALSERTGVAVGE